MEMNVFTGAVLKAKAAYWFVINLEKVEKLILPLKGFEASHKMKHATVNTLVYISREEGKAQVTVAPFLALENSKRWADVFEEMLNV
ncbi:hypothetical protein H8959_013693 [Pygathrix nigripes]